MTKQNNTPVNLLLFLRESQHSFNKSYQTIAKFLLDTPKEAAQMDIRKLAQATYTSASTIIRFCQHLGFSGYKQLRNTLIFEIGQFEQLKKTSDHNSSMDDILTTITEHNIASLQESLITLNARDINLAIDILNQTPQILLFGMGSSHLVMQDAQLKFLRINKTCLIHSDTHTQQVMAKNATKEQHCALICSYSGETEEVLEWAKILAKKEIKTIAMTRFSHNRLSKICDITLFVSSSEPLIRHGAMGSRIAQLNLIDILYHGLILKQDAAVLDLLSQTQMIK